MFKKYIVLPALILAACVALTGCFGSSNPFAPQQTPPPEKAFKSIDEFKQAVAAAKADTTAADDAGLASLAFYYELKTPPEGAKVDYVKVSSSAVRVKYSFGATTETSFDNQIEIVWYRTQKASDFLSQVMQNTANYDSFKAGETDYIHITPDIQFIVTPAPGDTAVATPTPTTEKYCQFVYWGQGDDSFMSAVPLGFTKDDVGKYCQGVKVELK
jgi:hypothetical protein